MDVDNIPVGKDFENYLKSQVAACDAMRSIIGPNWVTAKDETGQRRLDNPEDFVVIEIAAALARDIPVVPLLVDGARMPKASELPDSLKPLARRQAIQIRHTNFRSDAEALVKRLREALGYDSPQRRWRVLAIKAVAAMAVLFLVAWGGYTFVHPTRIYLEESFRAVQQLVEEARAERERQARVAAEAEEKRKAEQAEQQRLAAAKAEQERQARAALEAEANRKADETERQRQANIKAEQEQEREAERQRNYDQTIAKYSETIRRDPKSDFALIARGEAYANKGENDRAIADFSKVVQINPKSYLAFLKRGDAYAAKGDYDRAIADYNEAIRISPTDAIAYCNRGIAKLKIKDATGNEDIAVAKRYGRPSLDCRA
jgi:tetratricopeptide (TPR) repeat protein